jgi:aldehyde dehydrogenase (NAD+)
MGPLIDLGSVEGMRNALQRIRAEGGEILFGGQELGGCYVQPALVKAHPQMPILKEEVFAPILYLVEFDLLDQVIQWHNDVPQGLSSAMFTTNMLSAETFLSARGSDCGIANINIGTSGAEIGGAFGGEKETGGGRESGSDSWKAYMRRQTVTINWSNELPLAQGIKFEI